MLLALLQEKFEDTKGYAIRIRKSKDRQHKLSLLKHLTDRFWCDS